MLCFIGSILNQSDKGTIICPPSTYIDATLTHQVPTHTHNFYVHPFPILPPPTILASKYNSTRFSFRTRCRSAHTICVWLECRPSFGYVHKLLHLKHRVSTVPVLKLTYFAVFSHSCGITVSTLPINHHSNSTFLSPLPLNSHGIHYRVTLYSERVVTLIIHFQSCRICSKIA